MFGCGLLDWRTIMAIALHSYKIDKDRKIRVRHTFYAATEEEAEELMEDHGDGCEAFGPALDAGNTIEISEDIADTDLPDVATLESIAEAEDPEEDDDEPDETDDEEPGEA